MTNLETVRARFARNTGLPFASVLTEANILDERGTVLAHSKGLFIEVRPRHEKVVLDGGSLVLPVFHSTAPVNLKTLRLEVVRGGPDSLITKDRMRVDIGAEFYVRVKPDMSSIALAARAWRLDPVAACARLVRLAADATVTRVGCATLQRAAHGRDRREAHHRRRRR